MERSRGASIEPCGTPQDQTQHVKLSVDVSSCRCSADRSDILCLQIFNCPRLFDSRHLDHVQRTREGFGSLAGYPGKTGFFLWVLCWTPFTSFWETSAASLCLLLASVQHVDRLSDVYSCSRVKDTVTVWRSVSWKNCEFWPGRKLRVAVQSTWCLMLPIMHQISILLKCSHIPESSLRSVNENWPLCFVTVDFGLRFKIDDTVVCQTGNTAKQTISRNK